MIHASFRENRPAVLRLWRGYTLLSAVQGVVAIALIFQTRSVSGGPLLGISPFRLVIAALILLASLALLGLFALSWQPARFDRLWNTLSDRLDRRKVWSGALVAGSLILFFSLMWVLAPSALLNEFTNTIFLRLQPLALWLAGLAFLTVLALLVLRHGPGLPALRPRQRFFYIVLLALIGVFLAWAWAARAVLPTESQRVGWNGQGAPVMETQLLLAWAAGMLMLALLAFLNRPGRAVRVRKLPPIWLDMLVGLAIWLAAVIIWQGIPLQPNWFLSEPVQPNFEYYPSSDARAYDVSSQTALIGAGYRFYGSPYVRRSLLAMYLTVLHWIGGQQYERVIFLQILALALIPVLVYFVTRSLHNRISGVIAAVMVLLKEANAIRLATDVTTSHVKLIMADLPATLLVLVFALLAVRWLQHIERRPWLALAAGGALGFSMLVRLETVVFILPVALVATILLWSRRCYRLWLHTTLAALLGIGLVLAPWVWRNYQLTDQVFIDDPNFSMALLIQRFNPAGQKAIGVPNAIEGFDQPPPGGLASTPAPSSPSGKRQPAVAETPPAAAPAAPAAAPGPTPVPAPVEMALVQESGKAIDNITRAPAQYLAVVAAHMLNSQVQTFLVLPTACRGLDSAIGVIAHRSLVEYLAGCCSAEGYVRRLPYWRSWDGSFPPEPVFLLAVNLLVIAAGITRVWQRWRWAGLAPLFMGLTYVVCNGLLRNSGGRYVLPVDWISLLYFSVGLAHVSVGLLAYLTGRIYPQSLPQEADDIPAEAAPVGWWGVSTFWRSPRFYGLALGLFLLACAVPLVEKIPPFRYPPARQQQMLQSVLGSEQLSGPQRQSLQAFLKDGAIVLSGRALYPRFFPPKVGDEVKDNHPFAPRPYPRLGFYLAGLQTTNLVLPVEKRPASFPNASDVLIIACPPYELLAVARFTGDGSLKSILLRSPFPAGQACPLPTAAP